jgi:hypothetical protein
MFMKANLFLIVHITVINAIHAQTWRQLNPPPNIFSDGILSIASDTIGNLYAAGKFKNANNEFIVARWNGSSWAELGSPYTTLKANNVVTCLALDKKGNLYAAGGFTDNTGNYYIAKWDGNNWSSLGSGATALKPNNLIYAMSVDGLDNVYVAGGFTNSAGKQYVAKWDGTKWNELGSGANSLNANGLIYSITVDIHDNVYTAGHFANNNGKYYVAEWNGTSWSEVGASSPLNANDYINCVRTDKFGNVYTGGDFTANPGEYSIEMWNGTNWSQLGKMNGTVNTIAVDRTGIVYVAGFGTDSSGRTDVIKWDGNSWVDLFNVGYAAGNAIRTLCLDNSGNVYAGGDFKNGGNHSYVAKWNGTIMKELGRQGEFLRAANRILAVTPDIYGNVYAIGDFYNSGNVYDVAKWDGIGWLPVQSTDPTLAVGWPETMTTDSLGNIYVAGRFKNAQAEYFVARWDGANWREVTSAIHPLRATDHITKLVTDKHNNVYATGVFVNDNNVICGVAKWNGAGWEKFIVPTANYWGVLGVDTAGNVYISYDDGHGRDLVSQAYPDSVAELGTGSNALNAPDFIYALVTDLSRNVYVSGRYNYVSKWNGSTWITLGSPLNTITIDALVVDSAGNVCAAENSVNRPHVAKWNGSTWSELGGAYSLNAGGNINVLSKDILGNIYAAGGFSTIVVYGNSVLILQQPIISPSPSQFCKTDNLRTFKIVNLPNTTFVSASVTLDNVMLTINADSTVSFNPSTLSEGSHRMQITYYSHTDTLFTFKAFEVTSASTPDVKVTASATTATNSDPIVITGVNVSGGGTAPKFTFSKDRSISLVLQAESTNNVFILDPATLAAGENRIYVRMRTSDSCYTVQTNVDSISITKAVATGVIDIDYPNQQISIYPNPFEESFTIDRLQSVKSYTISLFNSTGQMITQTSVHNKTKIQINQRVSSDCYWLTIYDNSKNRLLGTVPLIKQ